MRSQAMPACTICVSNKKVRIITRQGQSAGGDSYRCFSCDAEWALNRTDDQLSPAMSIE